MGGVLHQGFSGDGWLLSDIASFLVGNDRDVNTYMHVVINT